LRCGFWIFSKVGIGQCMFACLPVLLSITSVSALNVLLSLLCFSPETRHQE
jgi:hypothetical protein